MPRIGKLPIGNLEAFETYSRFDVMLHSNAACDGAEHTSK